MTMNQKSAKKELEKAGWTAANGGKHNVKMVKPPARPIPLTQNHGRDYDKGTEAGIRKQGGLK